LYLFSACTNVFILGLCICSVPELNQTPCEADEIGWGGIWCKGREGGKGRILKVACPSYNKNYQPSNWESKAVKNPTQSLYS